MAKRQTFKARLEVLVKLYAGKFNDSEMKERIDAGDVQGAVERAQILLINDAIDHFGSGDWRYAVMDDVVYARGFLETIESFTSRHESLTRLFKT